MPEQGIAPCSLSGVFVLMWSAFAVHSNVRLVFYLQENAASGNSGTVAGSLLSGYRAATLQKHLTGRVL